MNLALAIVFASACAGSGSDNAIVDDGSEEENLEETDGVSNEEEEAAEQRTGNVDSGTRSAADSGRPSSTDSAITDTGASSSGDASSSNGDGDGKLKDGECCPDGKCLCHGPAPTALTSENGPFATKSYSITQGCIHYPDGADAKPPFAAVTVSDGAGGTGGGGRCGPSQTNRWGPFYASWGIVTMIVYTTGGDQPSQRGTKLVGGVTALKAENIKEGSPLKGLLAGRYGTSGFSMGGGGTSYASRADKTLLTSVAIMPWSPVRSGLTVPTLVICGSSDGIASCASHGNALYRGVGMDVPKMRVTVPSGHAGQPSAGMGKSGQYGLAFQKVFLEGDTRWRPLLAAAMSDESTIK